MKNKYDLSQSRKQELSDLAEFIADEYFPNTLISPHHIAKSYSISYNFGHYRNAFDGLLEHKADKFHIYLNLDKLIHAYTPRARFTFSHELGHYFIDEHRNALKSGLIPSHPSFTDFSSDNVVELEADFFASSLLMPSNRLIQDIKGRKFSYNLIDELRTKYQTSLTATLIKFASIGNHPIMIICAINKKIKWFKYSYDFPFKFINAGNGFTIPPCTSAGQYFYENVKNIDSNEIVFAEDWFKYVNSSNSKRKFYERCIYSDKNNFVLSIIWED